MLKLGEKGTILQRDKQTYAVAPHIPCGLATPQLLRKLADVAEKYNVRAIKLTGATRIALVGLKEADVDKVWQDLGMDPGHAVGLCVRSVRACPGTTYCRLGQQDALGLGLELDKRYHGLPLPNKSKIAVSGCNLNCAESWVRDVGLIGTKAGWTLVLGGNVGAKPRLAKEVLTALNDSEALAAVDRSYCFYTEQAKKGERIAKTIDRLGLDAFRQAATQNDDCLPGTT